MEMRNIYAPDGSLLGFFDAHEFPRPPRGSDKMQLRLKLGEEGWDARFHVLSLTKKRVTMINEYIEQSYYFWVLDHPIPADLWDKAYGLVKFRGWDGER